MINSRFFNRSELIGFVALAALLFVILPLSLDVFRLNLVAKYLTYAFVGDRAGAVLGLWRHSQPGAGGVLRPRRLLHGDVPQARGIEPREHQDPVDPGHPGFHGLESDHLAAAVLAAVPQSHPHHSPDHPGARPVRLRSSAPRCSSAASAAPISPSSPRRRGDPDHPDRRTAGLYRRHQRHDRPAHPEGLGHPAGPRQGHSVLLRGGPAVRLHPAGAVHPH